MLFDRANYTCACTKFGAIDGDRNFAGVVKNAAEGLVYTDNARAVTLNSRDRIN